jgi:signal peptidase II
LATEDGLRPRRVGVLLGVASTALVLDVITKVIAVAGLEGETPIELLGGLLRIQVTRNSGAAFSIGSGLTLVFTLIAAGVVAYILRTAPRLRSLPWAVTLGLLLGGATGNLIDRVVRGPAPLRGHVVDWIELPHWPVFNLADTAIVCGGVLAVLLAFRGTPMEGTDRSAGPTPSAATPAPPGAGEADGTGDRREDGATAAAREGGTDSPAEGASDVPGAGAGGESGDGAGPGRLATEAPPDASPGSTAAQSGDESPGKAATSRPEADNRL